MNQEVGAPIADAKLTAVKKASIAACDVQDGIAEECSKTRALAATMQNPSFAKRTGPANCLTASEASAVNKIWEGPSKKKWACDFGLV